ncbi:MAG TPA: lysozyme inhibitor LprI family protein [Candidatus Angelobacter sp.]
MRNQLRLAALMVFLLNFAVSQQPADKKKPSENCGDLKTQMEITSCWENLARKAESELTALYQKVQKAIRAQMAEDDASMKTRAAAATMRIYRQGALEKLNTAQRAWTHYRDAQCDAEEQQYEGGSIAPSVHAGCMKQMAERRMDDLQKTYAIYLRSN